MNVQKILYGDMKDDDARILELGLTTWFKMRLVILDSIYEKYSKTPPDEAFNSDVLREIAKVRVIVRNIVDQLHQLAEIK